MYSQRKEATYWKAYKRIFCYVPEIIIHLDIFWNIAYILVTAVQEKNEKLEKERNKRKKRQKKKERSKVLNWSTRKA